MNDIVVHEARPSAMMTAADVLTQIKTVQEVMRAVMKQDTHYGVIPGTKKNSLYKPGAEVLCAVFRIADSYDVEDLSTEDVVRYRVTCRGTHQTTGTVMGQGMGECSSGENKYKWVRAYKPEWEKTPENRRRIVYGKDFQIMQVRTEPADLANTVLKMACKRAKIAMTLNVTAASDIFTQDIEDLDERLRETVADSPATSGEPQRQPVQSKSEAGKPTVDKGTGEVKDETPTESPPAPAGMLKLIRAKATAIGLTDAQLFAAHHITALEGINVAQGNAILKSIAAGPEAYATEEAAA